MGDWSALWNAHVGWFMERVFGESERGYERHPVAVRAWCANPACPLGVMTLTYNVRPEKADTPFDCYVSLCPHCGGPLDDARAVSVREYVAKAETEAIFLVNVLRFRRAHGHGTVIPPALWDDGLDALPPECPCGCQGRGSGPRDDGDAAPMQRPRRRSGASAARAE